MIKVFIPGGAGYLGSVLSTLLVKKNFKVTVFDSLMFDSNSLDHLKKFKNFKFKKCDVNDPKNISSQLKTNDVIIPLAALVGAPFCAKYPELAKKTNLDLIKKIVKKIHRDQL